MGSSLGVKMKTNYKIHGHSKHDALYGYCTMCLEKSKFRHCLVNGMNSIVCIFCLSAKPLIKGIKFPYYMILKKINFTHIIHRFFIRLGNPKRTFKILKHRNFFLKILRRLKHVYTKRNNKNIQKRRIKK